MSDYTFWMVLGDMQPVHRHPTIKAARDEADRLARKHPVTQFHILEAMERCEIKPAPATWTTLREAPTAAGEGQW